MSVEATEHNKALREALDRVAEEAGGFRCEAGDCTRHGGDFGTVVGYAVLNGASYVICALHWNLWFDSKRSAEERNAHRAELVREWGWSA